MSEFFTNSDIRELRNNPSEYVKLDLVTKISKGFDDKHLSKEEKSVASDILKLLAQDISIRIRMNISEKFCRSEDIPYEIIRQLAEDIEDLVAIPTIQFSTLLKEEDLLEIIKKDKGGKQRAVARRDDLSDKLVSEIITHGAEYTVEALIDSNAEKIDANNSERILNKFPTSEAVVTRLFTTDKIKPEKAQDLLNFVSENLRSEMGIKYNIPKAFIDSIVSTSTNAVSYNMIRTQISNANSEDSLKSIINKLHQSKQLNINLIAKVLSNGNIDFFLLSMAKLATVPKENAKELVNEKGNTGIAKLFEKAKLPEKLATATKVLYRLTEKTIADGKKDITQAIISDLESLAKNNDNNQIRYILNVVKMP